MMGPKELRTIREELERALTATGDDPIRWLEQRMTAPMTGANDVLQSLRRVLEPTEKKKPRKRRVGTKK